MQHLVEGKQTDTGTSAPSNSSPASSKGSSDLRSMTYDEGAAALAPVQRAGHGQGGDTSDVHTAAQAGVRGGGGALPHQGAIQAAFGHHDVGGINAHVGGQAAGACDAMGAQAYASGSNVAFKGAPSLHTAAHEAAHVVQQRGGVSLKGGVGQVGDSYEKHADAVADAVVGGKSAVGLLDQSTGGSGAQSASPGAVQQKPKKKGQKKKNRRNRASSNTRGSAASAQAPAPTQQAVAAPPSVLKNMAALPQTALGWLMPKTVGSSVAIETSLKVPMTSFWMFGEVGMTFGLESEVEQTEDGYEVESAVSFGMYGSVSAVVAALCGTVAGKVSVSAKSKDPATLWKMLSFALREHIAAISSRAAGWVWGDYTVQADELLAEMNDGDEFGLSYGVGASAGAEGESEALGAEFEGEVSAEHTKEWSYKKRQTRAHTDQGYSGLTDMSPAEESRVRGKRASSNKRQQPMLASSSESKQTYAGSASVSAFGMEAEFEFEADSNGEGTLGLTVDASEAIASSKTMEAVASRLSALFAKALAAASSVLGPKSNALATFASSFSKQTGALHKRLNAALDGFEVERGTGLKLNIEASREEADSGGFEWDLDVKTVLTQSIEMLGGRAEAEVAHSTSLLRKVGLK